MRRLFWCGTLGLSILWLVLPAASQAAYPGANGRVAYESNNGGADTEIMSGNYDGSGSVQLTTNTVDDKDPAWSPDGKKIAFAHFNSVSGKFEIWTMNADGTGQTALVTQGANNLTQPTWSPDGSKIAFQLQFSPTDDDIFTAATSGLNASVTGLVTTTANERNPAWSPNGTKVLFSRFTGTHYELWTVDTVGFATATVLADAAHDLTQPSWAPDASKIAYTYAFSGTDDDLYTANANGSGATGVATTGLNERNGAWAPKGTMIAFDRPGPDDEIYLMNSFGGTVQPMETRAATADHNPDWQPVTTAQVRPQGATPLYLPLTIAFKPCVGGTVSHPPPLSFSGCSPADQTSNDLIVGEPLVNGKGSKSNGFIKLKTLSPSDAQLTVSMTDVRCARIITGSCTAGPLSDFTGNLGLRFSFRPTDRAYPGGAAGTLIQINLSGLAVPCSSTPDPTVGSTCSVTTSLNTPVPGLIVPGQRASWVFDGAELDDPSGDQFVVPGTFYP